MAFELYTPRATGVETLEKITPAVSTLYTIGDMGSIVNGIFTLVAAGTKGTHVFNSMITPASIPRPANSPPNQFQTTALAEPCLAENAMGEKWYKTTLTGVAAPVILNLACNANASNTSVLVTFGGVAGDWTGGTLYSVDYGQQRIITNDTFGAGVHTFTINTPFQSGQNNVALTTGNTVSAVPFAKGLVGIKYNATTPYQFIDPSVAGKAGGFLRCEEVHLEDRYPYVLVSLPYLQ